MMISEEACFLREAVGAIATAETDCTAPAARLHQDILRLIADGQETWEALQAEK